MTSSSTSTKAQKENNLFSRSHYLRPLLTLPLFHTPVPC